MKGNCPECDQFMDETEFIQNKGICDECLKKKMENQEINLNQHLKQNLK